MKFNSEVKPVFSKNVFRNDIIYIAFDPVYAHPLPPGHRFPMLKYELIVEQLLYEGVIINENLFSSKPVREETVLITHERGYYDKLMHQTLSASEQRRIGFPQSPQLTQRELIITQGTIDCCYHAMQNGVALNVAGGTHHAYADHGEGFCLLNDMAVAANYLLHEKQVKQILIIDLDVHQGNGTAKIFANNSHVFTLSMHGEHNYPFHKERSDLDIPLKDGTDDATYLSILKEELPKLIDKVKPDFAFFLSGVDVLETDKFGKLKVTLQGCRQRDEIVFSLLRQHQIPVTVAMGGGYSPEIKTIVEAHCNTFKTAMDIYT